MSESSISLYDIEVEVEEEVTGEKKSKFRALAKKFRRILTKS